MNINLELTDVDLASDRSAIFNPLLRYNESKVGDPSLIPLNILIKGDKDDTPLGGTVGVHCVWMVINRTTVHT